MSISGQVDEVTLQVDEVVLQVVQNIQLANLSPLIPNVIIDKEIYGVIQTINKGKYRQFLEYYLKKNRECIKVGVDESRCHCCRCRFSLVSEDEEKWIEEYGMEMLFDAGNLVSR